MKIVEMLAADCVLEELRSDNKRDVLRELVGPLMKNHRNLDVEATVNVLSEREKLGSTGIGDGIAIPHGKVSDLDQLTLSFGRSTAGVHFDAMDGKPAHLFFLLMAPENSAGKHLKALAKISKMMKDGLFRRKLMAAKSSAELFRIIAEQDDLVL